MRRRRKARSGQTTKAAVPLRSPQPREERTAPEESSLAEETHEKKLPSVASHEIRSDVPAVAAELGLKVPPILFEGDEAPRPSTINPEKKYALAPSPTTVTPGSERKELREGYGTGRLLAVARDPHCLYVHWDLTPEQKRQLNGLFQHHRLFVRVRPEGQVVKPPHEIPVQPEARHWFIQADEAGAHYVAELGYYGSAHDWKAVQVSQPVRLPSESVSAEKRAHFTTFDPNVPLPTGAGKEVVTEQRIPPNQPLPGQAPSQLTFPLVPRLENVPRIGETEAASPLIKNLERATPNLAPTDIAVEDLASEWTASQEQALETLIGWSPSWKQPSGSAEIEHLLKRMVPQPTGVPASLEAASQEVLVPSSPTGAPPVGPVGFWLNVNTELIVYGATDPKARLTLGGHPIPLRPDGTFSCRFALPDGQFELPISAESDSGEIRQVSLVFGRSTTYKGEVGVQPQDPALNRAGDKTAV